MLIGQPSVNHQLVDTEFKEAVELQAKKRKRDYSEELIHKVTDAARQSGAVVAQRAHPTVCNPYDEEPLHALSLFRFLWAP